MDLTVRGIRAFLGVEAGITRDGVVEPAPRLGVLKAFGCTNAQIQRLRQIGRRIARKGRTFRTRTRRQLGGQEIGGVRPENIVWIFGSAGTESTWLADVMGELRGHAVWFEPWVGALFDPYRLRFEYHEGGHSILSPRYFILSPRYRKVWLKSIRSFILDGARARFPEMGGEGYLVVKESGGSVGAPLLMEALSESRMILLVRDPRDAVASSMDARREGGWHYESRNKGAHSLVNEDPDTFVRNRAKDHLQKIRSSKRAYEAHKGAKSLVRYEELRADALGAMRRIYSDLGIPVEEGQLRRAVEKHSWENVSEEEKGEGKIFRKARPGGGREDLTPEQARMVERMTAPLLEEFYPEDQP